MGVERIGIVVLCFVILISGCLQQQISKDKIVVAVPEEEFFIYPEDFIIFQDYIETIGGKPRERDIEFIEATVLSITKTEVCPYTDIPVSECGIEPYPKDFGLVRVDKIIYFTQYSEQTVEPTIEQPSEEKSLEGGERIPEYRGPEYPSTPKLLEYESLREGQEIPTVFLLTARPAKIRYMPIKESKDGPESAQLPEGDTHQSVGQQVEPGKRTFKPIPKDGDYFVFTTKIGKFPKIIEKNLPGLEVGSKFSAEIYYDGSLYVEEYKAKNNESDNK